MKNLKNYKVVEINKMEALQINGGKKSLPRKLGEKAHRLWCGIKDGLKSYVERMPNVGLKSTF